MAKPRMIQSQFGTTVYNSGTISPTLTLPVAAGVSFQTGNGILAVDRHNDVFHIDGTSGTPVRNQLHYMTYDYIDLRDLMRDEQCIDDVTINVQRLREIPLISAGWNLPPANGVEETLLFVLGDLGLGTDRMANVAFEEYVKAGFAPQDFFPGTQPDATGASLPFQILYREIRRYMPDLSQTYSSTNAIGTFAGSGDATLATTTFCGRLNLTSRTIGGYPDLLVGPGITVIRVVSCYLADRGIQSIDGGGATDQPADQLTHLSSQISFTMPALQFNIVGTQRAMTDTEIATYYSNILVNTNQE